MTLGLYSEESEAIYKALDAFVQKACDEIEQLETKLKTANEDAEKKAETDRAIAYNNGYKVGYDTAMKNQRTTPQEPAKVDNKELAHLIQEKIISMENEYREWNRSMGSRDEIFKAGEILGLRTALLLVSKAEANATPNIPEWLLRENKGFPKV